MHDKKGCTLKYILFLFFHLIYKIRKIFIKKGKVEFLSNLKIKGLGKIIHNLQRRDISMKTNKAIKIIIITKLFQIITLLSFAIHFFKTAETTHCLSLVAIFAMTCIFEIIFLNSRHLAKNRQIDNHTKRSSYENVKKLNLTLKAQRHDFINHIQVIYSLLQLNKKEEAQRYIIDLYSEIKNINSIIKTENAILNALLQSKIKKAEDYGIDISFEIDSDLERIKLKDWELSAILSNIIDNAIDACKDLPEEMRIIEIDVFDDDIYHVFSVNNKGPVIDKNQIDEIFKPGFTTKGKGGNGLGLYIVDNIISKHGGTITVESNQREGTTFKVRLPLTL